LRAGLFADYHRHVYYLRRNRIHCDASCGSLGIVESQDVSISVAALKRYYCLLVVVAIDHKATNLSAGAQLCRAD
jgi:hypothetical protein